MSCASSIPQTWSASKGRAPWAAVRGAFWMMVCSLPFQMGQNRILPWELPTVASSIFLLVAFLQAGVCFKWPPGVFWCFVLYLYAFLTSLGFHGAIPDGDLLVRQIFWTVQSLLIFWAAYNLLQWPGIARGALLGYVLACALVALMQVFGLTKPEETLSSSRASAFGNNPATVAGLLAVGVVALTWFAYGSDRGTARFHFLAWPLFALMGLAIVQTASRGPILALALGLLILGMGQGSGWVRVRNVAVIFLGIGFLGVASYRSEAMKDRFKETLRSGDMAGREDIYPAAWAMVREKPLLGWGPVTPYYELQDRVRDPGRTRRDTHNTLFDVLTVTGLSGTLPFVAGVVYCGWTAWSFRGGAYGIVPFSMLTTVLVVGMSMNWFYTKTLWLTLAYALASSTVREGERRA